MEEERRVTTAELVYRIQARDPEAECELIVRYSRRVSLALRHLTGDRARADDLHQETFRLVLEKVRAGELRAPAALSAFIRQIARNQFIAEVRRRAKQPRTDGDGLVDLTPASTPSPLQCFLDKENVTVVGRLLSELEPARDREIIYRRFVAEHSKEEICADFGLSSLHFNRVLYRARVRLKELWKRHDKRQRLPSRRRMGARTSSASSERGTARLHPRGRRPSIRARALENR